MIALWLAGCVPAAQTTLSTTAPKYDLANETAVMVIPLAGPVSEQRSEISGLAWYGDQLIILPQYPSRFDDNIFALPRGDISGYLDGTIDGPLLPRAISLLGPDPAAMVAGFQGFEAIAFSGNQVFLTIEAQQTGAYEAFLVDGYMAPDLSGLVLDGSILESLPQQVNSPNHTDEALLVAGDSVLTLFELNGSGINPSPHARRFDSALTPTGMIEFPALPFRVTDATAMAEDGTFWVINYNYPGEELPGNDLPDPLVIKYGQGSSHAGSKVVERLVQLQYSDDQMALAEAPPIQLMLRPDGEGRNWEGIVRLEGRGFLIATDKWPATLLAFVPYISATAIDDSTDEALD